MPRWKQDRETGELIELDERVVPPPAMFPGAGVFEAFKSPVDGSIIKTKRDLEEHNRRNGVVLADEFSPEWYEKKAKEREAVFTGNVSREEQFRRRQEIYETMMRAERNAT